MVWIQMHQTDPISNLNFGQKWCYFSRRQMTCVTKEFARLATFDAMTSAAQTVQTSIVTYFHEFKWIAVLWWRFHFRQNNKTQVSIHSKVRVILSRTATTSKQNQCETSNVILNSIFFGDVSSRSNYSKRMLFVSRQHQ